VSTWQSNGIVEAAGDAAVEAEAATVEEIGGFGDEISREVGDFFGKADSARWVGIV
jgi:hypothetical protein